MDYLSCCCCDEPVDLIDGYETVQDNNGNFGIVHQSCSSEGATNVSVGVVNKTVLAELFNKEG